MMFKIQLSLDAGNTWKDWGRGRNIDKQGNIVIKTYSEPEADAILKQLELVKKEVSEKEPVYYENTIDEVPTFKIPYVFRKHPHSEAGVDIDTTRFQVHEVLVGGKEDE